MVLRMHDKERRLTAIAEATWRVMLREGLAGASLRAIARELGGTTGVLSHYFADKDALLRFALEHAVSRLLETMCARAEGASGLAYLERLLLAALPSDPASVTLWQVWLLFLRTAMEHAADTAALREDVQRHLLALERLLSDTLVRLKGEGALAPELDTRHEAQALLAFIDGLGLELLCHPQPFALEEQRALVERYIARVLAPSSPAHGDSTL